MYILKVYVDVFQELKHDKKALQAQVIDQMTQLSSLKSQVEDLKLGADLSSNNQVKELRKLLLQEREALEDKDKEVSANHTCLCFNTEQKC